MRLDEISKEVLEERSKNQALRHSNGGKKSRTSKGDREGEASREKENQESMVSWESDGESPEGAW